jgi:hypothetical protein
MRPSNIVAGTIAAGILATGCSSAPGEVGTGAASTAGGGMVVVTASQVQGMKQKLTGVQPPVRTPSSPAQYLDPSSCLGGIGPISAWGPLGAFGPVGDNSWNASAWISPAFSAWGSWFSEVSGPLTGDGPLGPSGPLGDQAYNQTLPGINDFSRQLQAGGVWTVLGPLGPLGPLGALGPLGPTGGFGTVGLTINSNGAYVDGSGNPVRTITINDDSGNAYRTYGYFEKYTKAYAQQWSEPTPNDTSFMVVDALSDESGADAYAFTSAEAQFITVLVTAENGLSDFDLEVDDSSNNAYVSNSDGGSSLFGLLPVATGNYIDFVQIQVAAGETLTAKVTAKSVFSGAPNYRLFVVGSTKSIDTTSISGPQQRQR